MVLYIPQVTVGEYAVQGFNSTAQGSTTIDVAWDALVGTPPDFEGFKMYVNGSFWGLVTDINATSWQFAGMPENTSLTFHMSTSYNLGGTEDNCYNPTYIIVSTTA